jgi:hypothetical protein
MSDKTINKDSLVGNMGPLHIERFRSPSFSANKLRDIHVRLNDNMNWDNKKMDTENADTQRVYSKGIIESNGHMPPFMDPEWSSMIDGTFSEEQSKNRSDGRHFKHSEERRKSAHDPAKFWFEDPKSLIKTFDAVPNDNMNDAERLNAMTRMIIIITAVMFVVKFPLWWLFLALGLLVVIIFWYIIKGYEEIYANQVKKQREYLRPPRGSIVRPLNNIIRPIKRESNIDNSPFSRINNIHSLNIISRKR